MVWLGYKLYLSLALDEGRLNLGAAEPAIKFDLDAVRHASIWVVVAFFRQLDRIEAPLREIRDRLPGPHACVADSAGK
jgi:hypothetical protein